MIKKIEIYIRRKVQSKRKGPWVEMRRKILAEPVVVPGSKREFVVFLNDLISRRTPTSWMIMDVKTGMPVKFGCSKKAAIQEIIEFCSGCPDSEFEAREAKLVPLMDLPEESEA